MPANDSEPRIVLLKNLRGSTKPGGNDSYEIKIPIFQRGIVWNEIQKKKLIESIKLGYPVGSLMAYQTFESSADGPRAVWSLIDGLQRTSTIIEYLDSPFKVADPSLFYTSEHVGEIARIIFPEDSVANAGLVTDAINEWLVNVEKNDPSQGFHAGKLTTFLAQKLFNLDHLSIDQLAALNDYLPEKFFDHINKEIDKIEDASLPFIVYTGPVEQVPEIFERINTQGMKLSKYETYAASWSTFETDILSEDVKAKISKKYEELENQGYVIAGYSSGGREIRDFNLFEYLFGLGKLLSDKHKFLFRTSSDPSDPVPIAFVIATVAHNLPISKMRDLAKTLSQPGTNKIKNLSNFEQAVLDSCQAIEDNLKGFLSINLNSAQRDKQFIAHSDNQILSYVVRYLLEKYDHSNNWSIRNPDRIADLLSSIRSFYVLDILNGEWSGSGDSKLYRTCWDLDADSPTLSSHYLTAPTLEEWVSTLDSWHNRELSKTHKDRTSNSTEAKLLLKFMYQNILTVAANEDIWFHIEHLWSVDKLKSIIQVTNSDGWPIGAFSNLALLKREVNQQKGTMMLGDYLHSPSGKVLSPEVWKQIRSWVISPKLESLEFDAELTKESYISFCKERYMKLRSIILREAGFSSSDQELHFRTQAGLRAHSASNI